MKAKVFCLFLLIIASGCSSSRIALFNRNHNNFFNRNYHELTTYYNVFFNGKESMKQASKKIEAIEPQNFDDLLPVFAFHYPQASGMSVSEAQRAIDKGTKAIDKHSITAKPKRKKNMTREEREFYNKKEFNRFIDDAQLLVAKSNIYMHEYDLALDKFEFISTEYPKESSVYEAQVWQAVILAYNNEYVKAEDLLVSLTRKKDNQALRKIAPLLNAAFADLYIKQKKFSEAIPFLEKALKGTRKKNTKIRYHYILGQLYSTKSDNSKAAYHFTKVLKKNPPYFTAFSAEMAMAHAYDPKTQKGNIRKILEKALKNPLNAKYHDQIYYAFAKLEESEGNMPKALEYYRKSVTATGINTRQKGLSYLALAEYYIAKPDYLNAYVCYDSSATLLGNEHSQYKDVVANATKYRKLALNLKIVEREDSLQNLANLSDEDLDKLIETRLKQEEEKRLKAEEEKANLAKLQSDIDAVKGQWYFYNATSLALGRKDFEMRWGDRKLEDNWRRKNKGIEREEYGESDDFEEIEIADKTTSDSIDKDAIKANIPKTAEAKNASNDKIVNAMYNIGEAFRDDLKLPEKSAEVFENLIKRFPENSLLAETYTSLYEIYTKLSDAGKAGYYKNLMLQNYPKHPKVLAATDPNYVSRMLSLEASEEADYSAALALYTANRKNEAFRAAENGLQKYSSGRLVPQFLLLKVLTDNYNKDIIAYRNALKEIVSKHKGNEAAVYAQTLLTELEKDELSWTKEPTVETQKVAEKTESYSTDDGTHSFIVVTDAAVNTNKLRFNILSFTADNFSEDKYDEVQVVDFVENKMLIMTGIKDKKAAISFYNKISVDKEVFKELPANDYVFFVILDKNLEIIRKSNSFIDYMDFFYKEIKK